MTEPRAVPSFDELLREYQCISGAIVASGGMATKSKCEDVLMERYDIDRSAAHDIANTVEYRGLRPIAPSKDAYYSIDFKWQYGVYAE